MNNAVLYAVRIKWIKYPPLMKLYIPKIAPTKQVDALSKILGHSSVAFTMQRYTTIFNDYLFE